MTTGESGRELYAFAQKATEERGWVFNLRGASGHRLSDFPHVIYHRGSLEAVGSKPLAARWVLEI
jgi:hypothetical protein